MVIWELSPGVTQTYPLSSTYYCPLFSTDNVELAILGETARCQMEKCEILYSLLFIYSSMCLNERLRLHTQFLVSEHRSQPWKTLLSPGAGCVQGGMRAGAWSCLLAVQWLLSASEVPEHRGKGGGAAKGKVSPCFLGKFNVLAVQMETCIPGKCLPPLQALISQGCVGQGVVGFFTFPWHRLTPGPTGILAMSPAGSTAPALSCCFSHLNSFNIYSLYSLNTRMLRWLF